MSKVTIISGAHKGKTGTVTKMYWMSGMCTVRLEDGKQCSFAFREVKSLT